jgi:RNA polymerase sigma-70 factor (ECF subfamily)
MTGSAPQPAPSSPASDRGLADHALVTAALAGDAASGQVFLARMACAAVFLNVQNRRFGAPFSREELCDLAQDAIAIVWGKLGTYEGRGPLEAWVYRICALEFMNALRRHTRRRGSSTDVHEHDPAAEAAPDAYASLDLVPLRGALVELSRPEQEVVRMRHFEELSYLEIAAALALPLNTVKSHYHRALLRLRDRLRGAYAEEPG